jgi:pimeloyl-ACP methyl ester carboxylesterase
VRTARLLTASLAALLLGAGSGFGGEALEARMFDSKGVAIQYTVEGAGEPVVLIHGLLSSGGMNWRFPGITRILAKKYQVITMDVRGHGGSGTPEGEAAYGVELVEDVVRLMDHLHVKQAHVVGYSMGGMITMKLLTRHPERVRSAVLGGMGWLREGDRIGEFWSKLPDSPRGSPPAACIRSLGTLAVTEAEVKAIRVPVAVLIGEHDRLRELCVAPLERIRPDWPVTVIEGANHLNCIFKSQFKTALKAALDRAAATEP